MISNWYEKKMKTKLIEEVMANARKINRFFFQFKTRKRERKQFNDRNTKKKSR